ncbi:Planctomycete cytochrome C [Stieleria neptunia]|uniref:Planctomycete cytochrome C n=1 Tax=Stieleria neptunia TaxID=2527979 RepID=A0A518HK95_9BACT|nr:PSD1 and planctomycete cytochrome C domain-containing protein [Stieleria neptunia]QDV41230.1 Planctomycete cytochrome C [Stieleria neptunia]
MSRLAMRLMVLLGLLVVPTSSDADDYETFERKVRPLLVEHCYKCHSAEAKTLHGGLRLDTAEGVRQGGDSGAVVVAGKPDESLLIETLRYGGDIQMPPDGKLSPSDLATLTNWVQQGASFPPSEQTEHAHHGAIDFDEGRRFWSFQPVQPQPLPDVDGSDWPQTLLDSFVLAAMQRHDLTPTSAANRATLVRRLCFDVTGLPPTPAMVRDFVDDASPDAYRRLVDRLLDSPKYGEKWGRWWLDMARYTDRTASWLYQTGQSHFYRDWVVDAFNQDMSYDEFVRRQLATDLMPETGPRDLPALGFISLSPTYWKELKLPCEIIKVIVADEWEERVDAVSRTFLGLTVACARCHDHKFDPISTEDYYALAGIFASCRQVERPLVPEEEYEPVRLAREQVAELEAEIAKRKREKPAPAETIANLTAKIKSIKASTPRYDMPMANALTEESMFVVRAGKTPQDGTKLEYRAQPRDLPAFIRGNPNRPGQVVPRRFLTVLSGQSEPYRNGSGRLELAESILTDAAPLTARVIVNRIWLAHFGQGLVDTPSNFGTQGSRPSHPELLDDLAARFIASGWSMKQLHRQILLSATWQQSSSAGQDSFQRDPENRWLSRMNPRRLTYEEWRDSMLSASGELNLAIGGPSIDLDANSNRRRTLYATVHRRDMSPTLMVHDFPDPTQHSPQRTPTITALQGLYALNGPLLLKQSQSLITRLQRDAPNDPAAQIHQLYWLLFSRPPDDRELRIGLQFLKPTDATSPATRLQPYAHALLVSNQALFVE